MKLFIQVEIWLFIWRKFSGKKLWYQLIYPYISNIIVLLFLFHRIWGAEQEQQHVTLGQKSIRNCLWTTCGEKDSVCVQLAARLTSSNAFSKNECKLIRKIILRWGKRPICTKTSKQFGSAHSASIKEIITCHPFTC